MAKKDTTPAGAGIGAIAGVRSETAAPIADGIQVGGFLEAGVDPFAHVGDAHWGKGGRYIVGADGNRVPAPLINEMEAEHG